MYHFTDGGLRNIWLRNGYEMHETPYGKAVSFQDGDGLIRAVCLALTRKVVQLTGVEFRYIRSSGFLTSHPPWPSCLARMARPWRAGRNPAKCPSWPACSSPPMPMAMRPSSMSSPASTMWTHLVQYKYAAPNTVGEAIFDYVCSWKK